MADIFEIVLTNDLFDKVEQGKTKYLVVLNDNKVKTFKEKNILTIKNEDDKVFKATISRILQFEKVKDVIDMLGKTSCGFGCRTNLDKIEDFYTSLFSQEKILKFGLVALEVVVG